MLVPLLLVQGITYADDAALLPKVLEELVAFAQSLPIHMFPYQPQLCLDASKSACLLPPTNVFVVVQAAVLQVSRAMWYVASALGLFVLNDHLSMPAVFANRGWVSLYLCENALLDG